MTDIKFNEVEYFVNVLIFELKCNINALKIYLHLEIMFHAFIFSLEMYYFN